MEIWLPLLVVGQKIVPRISLPLAGILEYVFRLPFFGCSDFGEAGVLIDGGLPKVELGEGICAAAMGIEFPALVHLHRKLVMN